MCQLEDKALNFPLSILHNQLCILKKNGERITQFLFALSYIFLCCIAIGFALCLRRVHVNFNDKSVMFAHTIMFYSFSIHLSSLFHQAFCLLHSCGTRDLLCSVFTLLHMYLTLVHCCVFICVACEMYLSW